MTTVTINGTTVLSTAQAVSVSLRQTVRQTDPAGSLVHTGRRSSQINYQITLEWPNASRGIVDAILWHHSFAAGLVFPWRRTPNGDGVRVQYSAHPRVRWNPGAQTARVQIRLATVRGISQTAIRTLFS